MAQHKWHKEIKAWADGAEIEYKSHIDDIWDDALHPSFDGVGEYRIKPQPKEPQYLYVYKPDHRSIVISQHKQDRSDDSLNLAPHGKCIGKIRLEVDDE